MVAAAKTRPAPSDEHLLELMALIKSADSVELKLTVPDLTLNQHGVVLRARRVQQKDSDSVVKLRPVVPSDLPKALRKSPAFGVEVDAMPGGFVCTKRGIDLSGEQQTKTRKALDFFAARLQAADGQKAQPQSKARSKRPA